jgi:hypothetical protein
MKLLTTLSLLLLHVLVQAQDTQLPIDAESGLVKYTKVVECPNMSKEDIYEKAKFWIVSTLKSGDNMVELDGEQSDKIVGTGNLRLDKLDNGVGREDYYYYKEAFLNFKFIVLVKDGKVKYSVENFELIFGVPGYAKVRTNLAGLETCLTPSCPYKSSKKVVKTFTERNIPYINKVIDSMTQDFITSIKKTDDDDW